MKKAIFPNERYHDFTSGNCEGKDFVFRPYKREGKDADPYGLICEKCVLHETDIDKRMAAVAAYNYVASKSYEIDKDNLLDPTPLLLEIKRSANGASVNPHTLLQNSCCQS